MRPEVRRRQDRAKKRQASKEYWKKNKAGDTGGQTSRPQPPAPMDDPMIFSDNRRGVIRAAKGGRVGLKKGGLAGAMPKAKPC
jgi:hypothetical protein